MTGDKDVITLTRENRTNIGLKVVFAFTPNILLKRENRTNIGLKDIRYRYTSH